MHVGTMTIGRLAAYAARCGARLAGGLAGRRLRRLARLAAAGGGRTAGRREELLERLYGVVRRALRRGDETLACRAVDVLKLALGSGCARDGEAARLTALCAAAMRGRFSTSAIQILEAYKPLWRGGDGAAAAAAAEQLVVVALAARQLRQPYALTKAAEGVFELATHRRDQDLPAIRLALRDIGLLALKRRDEALFREAGRRLADMPPTAVNLDIFAAWLHRIVRLDSPPLLEAFLCGWRAFAARTPLDDAALRRFVLECKNIAGVAVLNPRAAAAPAIVEWLLELAFSQRDEKNGFLLLSTTGKIAQLAVSRHGLEAAFPVLYPLLEKGRQLLVYALKFEYSVDESRRKMLYWLVREIVGGAAAAEKEQDMTVMVDRLYVAWLGRPDWNGSPKSLQRFCQLLLLYGRQIRRRRSNRPDAPRALPAKPLLTEREGRRLLAP